MAVKDVAVEKYVVRLTAEEREQLYALIHSGRQGKRKLSRAHILLKADTSEAGEGWSDAQIASALNTGLMTVACIRKRMVEEGLGCVLTPKRPAPAWRLFDGAAEAKLIALACSEPPNRRARWTLRVLADKVVELNIVARASDNTIGRILKKYSYTNRPTR